MLSGRAIALIREGVLRIRRDVPEATEDQIIRMYLYANSQMGKIFSEEEMAEIKVAISIVMEEFVNSLN